MTLKISVITVTSNSIKTVESTINSIKSQKYKNIEHICVDNISTDGTLQLLKKHRYDNGCVLISERDEGIYDAFNKGLNHASGDVVGFLNSDDEFADNEVVEMIAQKFLDPKVDVVYGDVAYVHEHDCSLRVRYWKSGVFNENILKKGWMPPHSTLYVKRSLIKKIGCYKTKFQISSDYDFILRLFSEKDLNYAYIPKTLVFMRSGGISNRSIVNVIQKWKEDLQVIQENSIGGFSVLLYKNLRKFNQLILMICSNIKYLMRVN